MNTTQAIPTEYAGIKFRSRLEARWAVFFDTLSVPWEYEPEAFNIPGNDCPQRGYTPDFWLPKLSIWAEVKGSQEQLEADGDKLAWACDFDESLPGVKNSAMTGQGGLLLLGSFSRSCDIIEEVPLFPLIRHYKGLSFGAAAFTADGGLFAGNGWCCSHSYGDASWGNGLWCGRCDQAIPLGPTIHLIGRSWKQHAIANAWNMARGHRFWDPR